jgi:hypothetical protein
MRTLAIVVSTLLAVSVRAESMAARTIDLDKPGAMDSIQKDDPERYGRIVEILRVSQVEPCETLPRVLKVRFAVASTTCHALQILTSYPPKRHLAFTLGDTGYVTNLVLTGLGGKLVPAKSSRP